MHIPDLAGTIWARVDEEMILDVRGHGLEAFGGDGKVCALLCLEGPKP